MAKLAGDGATRLPQEIANFATPTQTLKHPMSIQTSYDEWSTTYDNDENVTKELDARVTRETLGQLKAQRVLELGCGTGKNTAFLAERFAHVAAVDFSSGMLSRARERVAAANVTFVAADIMARWPSDDASIDLATINLVLEHIADLPGIFHEAARVLRPGGHLFVCELHPFRQYLGSQARFERAGEVMRIDAFLHHVSDYLSAASGAGFALVEFREWWHEQYGPQIPRLVSFLFRAS